MEPKKHETVFMAPSNERNESVFVATQTSHTPSTADLCITGVHWWISHQITKAQHHFLLVKKRLT
jgi:hypothetical protein